MNRQERQDRYAAKRKRQSEAKASELDVDIVHAESRLNEIVKAYPTLVHVVGPDDIQCIQTGTKPSSSMLIVHELLRPYLNLRDNDGKNCATVKDQLFIAEGTETVRVLLQQTTRRDNRRHRDSNNTSTSANELDNEDLMWPPTVLRSILIKPQLLLDPPVRLWDTIQRVVAASKTTSQSSPPLPVILVATEDVLCALTGFITSRGCLACGVVPPRRDESWLERFLHVRLSEAPVDELPNGKSVLRLTSTPATTLSAAATIRQASKPLRILALDGIADTANMGSMIRTAAALDIHLILLSANCCSPWYRKSVRVSMGHVGSIPICRVTNLSAIIANLSRFPLTSYAAVIDPHAKYRLHDLKHGDVPHRWCCVVGSEANGITPSVVQACDTTLRIDMAKDVDSLSVPIATGILLHGLWEREVR